MTALMFKSEYAKMFYSEDVLWWYQGLREVISFFLAKYAVANPMILDVGCGTGKNIEFLNSLGYDKIDGLDYSPDAVEFCRKRGLSQVNLGSITAIEHPEQSFDVVLCIDVLGSLVEDERKNAVAEMMRVLKPGGLLLANSASLEIFRSQHDAVINTNIRFNRSQFLDLFQGQQVEVLKLSYRVFLLSPLVGLFKFIKKVIQRVRPASTPQTDQVVFPFGINWCLLQVQLLENKILQYVNLPFGTSLFIAVRKR